VGGRSALPGVRGGLSKGRGEGGIIPKGGIVKLFQRVGAEELEGSVERVREEGGVHGGGKRTVLVGRA